MLTQNCSSGGKETPLSLLSMPVRLLRRLTGTACGRHSVAASAQGAQPFQRKGVPVILPPRPPILPPTRFSRRTRALRQKVMCSIIFYVFEINRKSALTTFWRIFSLKRSLRPRPGRCPERRRSLAAGSENRPRQERQYRVFAPYPVCCRDRRPRRDTVIFC